MGFERFIFDEEYLKELEAKSGNQALFVASPEDVVKTSFVTRVPSLLLFKLSFLLIPLLAYLGYHYWNQTEAGTTINTTITENDDLENGLVGHWTFDGGDMDWSSSTAELRDRTGNNNLDATNTSQSGVAIGKIGQGFQFDDRDDYFINTNVSDALDITATGTFAFWMKLSASTTNKYAGIISKGDGSSNWDYDIWYNGSPNSSSVGKIGIYTFPTYNFTNATITDSNWHHVALTRSGGTVRFYIDGNFDNSFSFTSFPNTSSRLTIGTDGPALGSFSYFGGLLDDIRIYNRSLSATEVKRLYELGATTHINTTIQENTDLSNGLLGHWTFDGPDMNWASTTAEVLDQSGNGFEGDATNMAISSVGIGKIGQTLNFDGIDDKVSMGNISSTIFSGDFAVSTWIYENSLATGFIAGKQTSAAVNMDLFVRASASNRYEFRLDQSTGADIFSPINSAIPNTWKYLTVTRSGTLLSMYIDGMLATTTTNNDDGSTTGDLVIGDNQVGVAAPWKGRIDDFRIYNRSLSASEVKRLYELGATTHINTTISEGPLSEGLIGYWTFNGSKLNWSSTTAEILDASGNNYHGDAANFDFSSAAIGKQGQGLRFDGTDDRIVVADDSNLEGMANLTIAAWIYQTGNGGGGLGRVLEKGNDYGLLYSGAGSNRWTGRINGVDADTATIPAAQLFNNWHHLAMVYDGATISMYFDGVVSGTPVAQTGNVATSSTALTIANTTGSRTFQGTIDDVRLYNQALSAEEIWQLYELGVGR